ncbi:MAG: hypothetical protein ACREBU_07615 [Nitrososphaera sp.]
MSKDESSVDQFAIELDIEEKVISKLLMFLRDMEWIKEENHHLWSITEKGDLWLRSVKGMNYEVIWSHYRIGSRL